MLMWFILLELAITIATFGSWNYLFAKGGETVLSHKGLASLKYYTTLSNLFAGITSLMTAVFLIVTGSARQLPKWLALLKYSSTMSILFTFIVVMVFLGPRIGYRPLMEQEQLFLHAVAPLLAVFSFFICKQFPELKTGDSFAAVVPTLLYAIGYVANIYKNGIGEGEDTNDWYGFAIGGIKSVPVAFVIIMIAAWAVALILFKLKGIMA